MRISDWSPDVCSSDLENSAFGRREDRRAFVVGDADGEDATIPRPFDGGDSVCGGAAGGDTQQDVVRADRCAVHLTAGGFGVDLGHPDTSDERRVGEECVCTCSYRWLRLANEKTQ